MDHTKRGVMIGLTCIIALCSVILFSVDGASRNLIERDLGFLSEGGDGSMEILLLVVLAMLVATAGLSLRSHSTHGN